MDYLKEVVNKLQAFKSNWQVSDVSSISALIATLIVLLTIIYYLFKHSRILPGPIGVPYFGLYPFVNDENCHLKFTEYTKKYGDAYSFTFTGKLIIHLGSLKSMRDLHVTRSDCFAGRFTDWNILTHVQEEGFAMVNGEPWLVLRKFFIQKFKDYGLYAIRDNMAGPVYDSLLATVEELKTRQGVPFNVVDLLTERCTVTIRKLFFGEDGVSEDLLREMMNAYVVALECMAGLRMLLIGPFGKFLFHTKPLLREGLKQHEILRDILFKISKKIESNLDEGHTTCILEDYYKERNERKRKGDPTWKIFSDRALVSSTSQFVGDGVQAVAGFIGTFLSALIEHPEEQGKLYAEIMEVVGPSRQPVLEDKNRLPYTNAFINEVIRTSCFFPLFPSLECTRETTYKGYRIPKGSITLLNFWAANHDPTVYDDPYKFNPSRYMSAPGKPRPELPTLFGIGKRACSGEPFVMMQAFLFLTTIIKNFEIIPPEDPAKNSAMYLMSGKLELCVKLRSEK